MIWDYVFTYGGPELFMLFVVLGLTPFIYAKFLKKRTASVRIASVVSIWALAFLAAYTDVVLIAQEASVLCEEEAGLRVYINAEPDGIYGLRNIEKWDRFGIPFVEHSTPAKRRHFREELIDGEAVTIQVDKPSSRYTHVYESTPLQSPITKGSDKLIDGRTGAVLGEIVAFKIYPGVLDSYLLGLVGFSWGPPRCDGYGKPTPGKRTYDLTDLVTAVFH